MPEGLVGFWSYVRRDNESDARRITRLAENIRTEYAMLTGVDLTVFVDRENIEWGQEWQRRIDEALARTAFFVPVITPRYFGSDACRAELLTFAGHASSLGLSDLLMPLLYVDVPELSPDSDDELVALVARRQYFDWRVLRLADESSSEYRTGVNALAVRLASVLTAPAAESATAHAGNDEEDDDALGVIEIMANAEAAMERVPPRLEALSSLIERIGNEVETSAAGVAASDTAGKGFAGRLTVAHQLAEAIGPLAEEFHAEASRYAAEMVSVDAGVLTLIRGAEGEDVETASTDDLAELLVSIRELAEAMREGTESIDEFMGALATMAQLSRELRRPVKRLQAGLQAMKDAQNVVQEWRRRADQLEL